MTRCWYFGQVHVYMYFGLAPKNTPVSGDKVVMRPESGGEISLPADIDAACSRLHSMTVVRQSRNDLQTSLAVAIFYAVEQDLRSV
jgi:hypothetical protein